MRFSPKSEEEIQLEGLMPEGNYQFEVAEAEDKVSKKGNDMIELKLKLWDQAGNVRLIYDYLLEIMALKLKHFADVVGLERKYRDGTLMAEDCLGKQGTLFLIKQAAQGGYDAKNSVKDYIVDDGKGAAKVADKKEEFDDAIPF